MSAEVRAAVCDGAVRAARAVAYQGAGTIEFIADASDGLLADRIWFMEMNTRLQVEHPVTEAITGLDLVEWQLRVAAGETLPLAQDQITLNGHAVEARLYAEDPAHGFLPSAGALDRLELPDTVRVDSGFEEGDVIPTAYDPMIAKLIAHGDDRSTALTALQTACGRVIAWPVRTNAGFLHRLLGLPHVVGGNVETGLIGEAGSALLAPPPPSIGVLHSAALAWLDAHPFPEGLDPWIALTGFRVNASARRVVRLECAGRRYDVDIDASPEGEALSGTSGLTPEHGGNLVVFADGDAYDFTAPGAMGAGNAGIADGAVLSPMPGRIVAVTAEAGGTVTKGAPLVTLEAMKMEHVLTAPFDGTVAEVTVEVGQQVSEGVLLARLEAAPSPA
jgi:acetyl/propionyl-CoA carboxylase alpha subunit